jgi:hypothetical protein
MPGLLVYVNFQINGSTLPFFRIDVDMAVNAFGARNNIIYALSFPCYSRVKPAAVVFEG